MGILKWTQGQLDSLVTVLNSKAKQADLVSGLSSKASAIHNHDTLYASINNAVPSVTGNNGKFLSTDGTTASWKDPKEVINLSDGKDVTITNPVTGQALVYNGSAWVNGNPSTAGNGGVTSVNGQTGAVTVAAGAPTTAQVLSAMAGASAASVGAYTFAANVINSGITLGQVVPGNYLTYGDTAGSGNASPSGSWRCMGQQLNYAGRALYLRIS